MIGKKYYSEDIDSISNMKIYSELEHMSQKSILTTYEDCNMTKIRRIAEFPIENYLFDPLNRILKIIREMKKRS